MPRRDAYQKWLKEDLEELIESLELSDLQKHFLRSRWRDQLLWMDGRANRARNWYYRLRLTTIIGGVIIPALVSLNIGGEIDWGVRWITIGLSVLVGISAAVEQFFNYGERWRHYRRMAETLKIEGWQFFQLSGPYRHYESHAEAYREFATRTEEVNQHDVEAYITTVAREKKEEEKEEKVGNAAIRNLPERW